MTTQLFYTDTLSSLAITGYVVRSMSTSRGSGVVSKTDNSSVSSVQVTDNGSTPLCFAYRVAAYSSTTGNYTINHWGLESNAMANMGWSINNLLAGLAEGVVWYANDGTRLGGLATAGNPSGTEYGTAAGAQNWTRPGTAQTVGDGDWVVAFPMHQVVGTGAAGFTVTFSYNGTSAAANGDSYVTLPDTVTAFTAATQVPYTTSYPALLAQ